MRKRKIVSLGMFGALLLALFAGGALAQGAGTATAQLEDTDGNPVGDATFTEGPNGVTINANLQPGQQGVEPGEHGIHIHETGEISPDFEAAGEHFNPRVAFTHPGGLLRFSRAVRFLGARALSVRAEIDIHVWGLGFSYVDVSLPGLGMKTRQFVLATPTDDYALELRYGMRIPDYRRCAREPSLETRYFQGIASGCDCLEVTPPRTNPRFSHSRSSHGT